MFLLLTTCCLPLTSCLFAGDFIFKPNYSVEEALAIPSAKEVSTELLWDVWKSLPESERGKTGVVLSGGGARGFAHIGVLRHLSEKGFPIDALVGTSMGAAIGGLYAAGIPIERIENMARESEFLKFSKVSRLRMVRAVLNDGLSSYKPFEDWLRKELHQKTFKDTKIPFLAVAADLSSGELVLLRDGELAPALRASATIPGLAAPMELRQGFLIDGGILMNVPTPAIYLLGAENVLVVDVSIRSTTEAITRLPSSIRTLYRALEMQGAYLENANQARAPSDFTLRPYREDIEIFEMWKYAEAWEEGLRQARQNSHEMRLAFIDKSMTKLGAKFFEAPLW